MASVSRQHAKLYPGSLTTDIVWKLGANQGHKSPSRVAGEIELPSKMCMVPFAIVSPAFHTVHASEMQNEGFMDGYYGPYVGY